MNRKIFIIIFAAAMISFFSVGCLNFFSASSQQSTFITTAPIDSTNITVTPSPTLSKAPTNTPVITSDIPVATVSPTPTKATVKPTPTKATATPTPTKATATPTITKKATPTPSSTTLEGEFIVINEYNVTSISYYRAILVNDDIILLTCPGTVYEMFYDLNTGLKTIMTFYIRGKRFSTKLDSRQYASLTSLQEVYLPDAMKNVYIGRTGVNISVKGVMTSVYTPGLKGLPLFEVSECDKIT